MQRTHREAANRRGLGWFGAGILKDVKQRWEWYCRDWVDGFRCGFRIIAPSVYVYLASILPALAFGEQLSRATDGRFNGTQVLIATALSGITQAVVGGQPLLIVGVAEPTVIMYTFMYDFAERRGFEGRFLPWCTWVAFWAGLMLCIMAWAGACHTVRWVTSFPCDIFGLLIAILFLQEAILGTIDQFGDEAPCEELLKAAESPPADDVCAAGAAPANVANGLWAVIVATGLVVSSLFVRGARSWSYFRPGIRAFLADFGVPLAVLLWSSISYAPPPYAEGTHLSIPSLWWRSYNGTWDTLAALAEVRGVEIAFAAVPGAIFAALLFFDHTVSSSIAQHADFKLMRPSAYHWDLFLLGVMSIGCGIIGVPLVNGVIPQAPMHTSSLQELQAICERSSKKGSMAELRGDSPPDGADADRSVEGGGGEPPQLVREQRLTNLIQSVLVGVSITAAPAFRAIPRPVVYGYFAYMALESLPGNALWGRVTSMLKDPTTVSGVTPSTRTEKVFTLCQVLGLVAVYGVTWAGIAGIAFPVIIVLLVPVRVLLLPRLLNRDALDSLDPWSYADLDKPAPGQVHHEVQLSMNASEQVSRSVSDTEGARSHTDSQV